MFKITLPLISFNGHRYGIVFTRGVGFTDDERIVELMRSKGFKVEKEGSTPTPEPKPPILAPLTNEGGEESTESDSTPTPRRNTRSKPPQEPEDV